MHRSAQIQWAGIERDLNLQACPRCKGSHRIRHQSNSLARMFGANYAGLPDVIMAFLVGKKLLVNVIADLVGVQLTFDAGIDAPR
ncbi:hypothetical protein C8Q73DRAFT_698789 [Cubamyces lactineus]|nr:hypothetical protein C8Q73DRAFT_698789 [Cubamyces lactineus]